MKRVGMIACCLVLAIACLTVGKAFAENKEVVFWMMPPDMPQEIIAAWLDQKAADFEKQTGYTLKYELIGWDVAWEKLSTALVSGEGPDAFHVGGTWNTQLAATGGMEEVNLADFGGQDIFLKSLLPQCSYDGKYYGVPWVTETRVLFYNKEMFEKAGVQPPTTHDELISVGKQITAKLGEGTAISLAGSKAWDLIHNWATILWGNGGQLLNADNTKVTFNGPEGVAALQWYISLFQQGLASKACAEYDQPQADSAFVSGNVAMCYMGPWVIASIDKQNPNLKYGIVEPPAGPKGKASFTGGENLSILKSSKNKEGAKAWIKYLLQPEIMADYTKNISHMLPGVTAAFDDPYYKTGIWKTFKDTLDYSTAYPPLMVWGDVENTVTESLRGAMADYVNGKYTDENAKAYLDKAAKQIEAALEKAKK